MKFLLSSDELNNSLVKFNGTGDCTVMQPNYQESTGRLFINSNQFFELITKKQYEYKIGGYEVLYQWLKARKGNKLSFEDIKHLCKVVTAIEKTMEIEKIIDECYAKINNLIEYCPTIQSLDN